MDNKQIIQTLTNLVQLDIDAIHAYGQAIKNIDVSEIAEKLRGFQADHERHVTELSEEIRKLGGQPPPFSRDFKGFLIEGFTAVRSMTGNEGALKAMKGNEQLTNRTYQQALDKELPEKVKAVVRRNYEDERRHLQYIEQALRNRAWERPGAAP